jgi:hypothetical protein
MESSAPPIQVINDRTGRGVSVSWNVSIVDGVHCYRLSLETLNKRVLPYVLLPRVLSRRDWMERYGEQRPADPGDQ